MHNNKLAQTAKPDAPAQTTYNKLAQQLLLPFRWKFKWKSRISKAKQFPFFSSLLLFLFYFHFDQRVEPEDEQSEGDTLPREPTALPQTFLLLSPSFVTLKFCCLTYKLIYKLHFSMNPFHCGPPPPDTFHRGQEFICKWNPEKCSPAPQRDRMPSHCSHSMGAAGIVGTAWSCSSRSTQSRSCLIQGLSPSMFLCSETSDNTKLPWQQSLALTPPNHANRGDSTLMITFHVHPPALHPPIYVHSTSTTFLQKCKKTNIFFFKKL